jgi:hypothetical protein
MKHNLFAALFVLFAMSVQSQQSAQKNKPSSSSSQKADPKSAPTLGFNRAKDIFPLTALDKIYKDETHCLVGAEIRSDSDEPISCYCRDALSDARYVYQTYLFSGKDLNLNGTYLTLWSHAAQECGKDFDVSRATHDADWRWNGPEVVRTYPTDREIEQLKPDRFGFRTVRYKIELVYPDSRFGGLPLVKRE